MNTAIVVFPPSELSRQERKYKGPRIKGEKSTSLLRMKRKTKRKKLAMEEKERTGE